MDENEITGVPLPTVMVGEACAAAAQLVVVAESARITQEPAAWNDTTPDAIEHTDDELPAIVKVTVPPLVAEALGV